MLAYFVLALFVAGAHAQGPCECGVFVTLDIGQVRLYEFPAVDLGDCTQDKQCERSCSNEFTTFTNGGDLTFISWDGVTPVGQLFCNNAAGNVVDTHFVYPYYNLCSTNWQWTGDISVQPLCCDASGMYYVCPAQ